jgi:esterase/lipase
MNDTLNKINQSIWELRESLKRNPHNNALKRDLLRFFFDSRQFVEMRSGLPEEARSFLYLQERESLCCYLIHGAGGSPGDVRQLGDYLFKHGYTVYAGYLPIGTIESDPYIIRASAKKGDGAGRKQAGARFSWNVCMSMAAIELETLLMYSANTYLFGFSFGGTIALNLMNKYDVKSTVLISPALFPVRTTKYLIFQAFRKVVPFVVRNYIPRESTVIDLIERTRSNLQPIDKPVMVIHAADDPVISAKSFHFLKQHSRNPKSRFELLKSGGHVIVKGEISEKVFRMCSDFIKEF